MIKKTTDRKFDTWQWKPTTSEKAESFEVRYRKHETANDPVAFYIYSDKYKFNLEDGNLEELRKKLDALMTVLKTPNWEPYCLVTVTGQTDKLEGIKALWGVRFVADSDSFEIRSSLELKVERIMVGTSPDGHKFHKVGKSSYMYDGLPGVGPLAGGGMRALIKDDLVTRAALSKLAEGMQLCYDSLKVALEPFTDVDDGLKKIEDNIKTVEGKPVTAS